MSDFDLKQHLTELGRDFAREGRMFIVESTEQFLRDGGRIACGLVGRNVNQRVVDVGFGEDWFLSAYVYRTKDQLFDIHPDISYEKVFTPLNGKDGQMLMTVTFPEDISLPQRIRAQRVLDAIDVSLPSVTKSGTP